MRSFLSLSTLAFVVLATTAGCKNEAADEPKKANPAAGTVQITVDITAGLT